MIGHLKTSFWNFLVKFGTRDLKDPFTLGDDDDDKVDLIKLLGIGCMATKESIHT